MMMRPGACLLVFLLSVASVCVKGDVKPAEKLLHEAAASECPTESQGPCPTEVKPAVPQPLPVQQPQVPRGGADCTTGPPCSTSSSRVATTGSPTNCENPAKKEGCPESVPQTETNCGEGSGKPCPPEQQVLTQAREEHPVGQSPRGDRAVSGSEPPDSSGTKREDGTDRPSTDTDPSNPSPNVAAPAPSGESVGTSASAAPPESSGNSDAGGNSTQPDGDATQTPSANSTNESAAGSENTTTGSESTNNPEGAAENTENTTTTTTTTTTTLPPELTNNKKGDADSSSSIISSVWV
ncbi:uncharacterized protein TM35_001051080, partial [Trypanosoma theileri]